MLRTRISLPEDVPAQRELWRLAFGDEGAYVDNFYTTYYRPERVLVLEEDGVVRAMTAWFDTALVLPGRREFRAAYLYAVATHPVCRGRGLAGKLLADADGYFRSLSIPAVTTVPAEPSLHNFFGANGFGECFVHQGAVCRRSSLPPRPQPASLSLEPLDAAAYGAAREELLAGTAHVRYPEDALRYQAGCCALSGGGLYRVNTPDGPALLCVERIDRQRAVVKELLGSSSAAAAADGELLRLLEADFLEIRTPAPETGANSLGKSNKFGMLKWLDPTLAQDWNWSSTAYLGLAFD